MALLPAATENTMIAAGIVPGTGYFLSLHSGSPLTTGANEVVVGGSGYARQGITFGAASAGVMTTTNAQTFANLPTEAGGLPFFGLWTAGSGGTYLGGGTTAGLSGAISAGSGVGFAIGAITVAVS